MGQFSASPCRLIWSEILGFVNPQWGQNISPSATGLLQAGHDQTKIDFEGSIMVPQSGHLPEASADATPHRGQIVSSTMGTFYARNSRVVKRAVCGEIIDVR